MLFNAHDKLRLARLTPVCLRNKFPIGAKTLSLDTSHSPHPPHCILNISNVKWYLCPIYTCMIQGLFRTTQATLRLRGLGSNAAGGASTVVGRAGREPSWGGGCEGTSGRGRSRPEAGARDGSPGSLGDSHIRSASGRHRLWRRTASLSRLPSKFPPEFLSGQLQPPGGGILGNVVRRRSALRKRGGQEAEGSASPLRRDWPRRGLVLVLTCPGRPNSPEATGVRVG